MIKVGKIGTVRLTGKDLEQLRRAVFFRDGGKCVNCGRRLVLNPESLFQEDAYHMAHKRNRRMWGDTLDNTHSKCPHCHLVLEHNPKSVPKKPNFHIGE